MTAKAIPPMGCKSEFLVLFLASTMSAIINSSYCSQWPLVYEEERLEHEVAPWLAKTCRGCQKTAAD